MKKEMNNKGFSLVELIIVIAIMVILVAVLAPQYLRYVEKSRVSTDTQTAVEFINALQVAASDPDANLGSTGTYQVSVDSDGAITVTQDLLDIIGPVSLSNDADHCLALLDEQAAQNSKFQSTAYKGLATASGVTGGVIMELEYNASGLWQINTYGIDQSGAIPSSGSGNSPSGT